MILIVFRLGSDLVIRCRYLLFFQAQVFGKTLVHEFHISNSHSEWNFDLLAMKNWKRSAIKLILLNFIYICTF